METVRKEQIEYRLKASLTAFGLNPRDWKLKWPPKSLANLHRKNAIELGISHRRDDGFVLKGQALLHETSEALTAQWISLSFCE